MSKIAEKIAELNELYAKMNIQNNELENTKENWALFGKHDWESLGMNESEAKEFFSSHSYEDAV
jgi:hypothetical protein